MKKVLSVLLCVAMILSMGLMVFAAEETTAEISFADKANRTTFSANQQVWEQNGIKVTNDKAASSNDGADYAKPARFYAGSKLTIEFPGMTKIEFACNSSKYATALQNSITGATPIVNDKMVTVNFTTPVDSFEIAKLSAQVRVDSITVTAGEAGGTTECTHAETAYNQTANGHKVICAGCGIDMAEETAHTYEGLKCVCGAVNAPAADSTLTVVEALALGAAYDHNVYTTAKY